MYIEESERLISYLKYDQADLCSNNDSYLIRTSELLFDYIKKENIPIWDWTFIHNVAWTNLNFMTGSKNSDSTCLKLTVLSSTAGKTFVTTGTGAREMRLKELIWLSQK